MDRVRYEVDDKAFPADAYRVDGWDGIAWHAYGWEVEPYWEAQEIDGEGYAVEEERRTGKVVIVMVGDDRRFTCAPDELTALDDEEYCAGCGQIGCGH